MKRQSTLSGFFKVSRPPPRIHFCLDVDSMVASFVSAPPKGYARLGEARVKGVGQGSNQAYLEVWRGGEAVASTPMTPKPRVTDVPLLMSNLQKSVRRGKQESAALTANELAHCSGGFVLLCRRLLVIAMEDVHEHTGRPADRDLVTLAWLMLALQCGHKPTSGDAHWLMRYAWSLAGHGIDEARPTFGAVPDGGSVEVRGDGKRQKVGKSCDWQAADERGDHVAMALLIRAAHGGMKCDVEMLKAQAKRDHTAAAAIVRKNAAFPFTGASRLGRDLVLLESVDFHIDSKLSAKIGGRAKVAPAEVEDMLWHFSSKINRRLAEAGEKGTPERGMGSPDAESLWLSMIPHVRSLQSERIDRAFKLL